MESTFGDDGSGGLMLVKRNSWKNVEEGARTVEEMVLRLAKQNKPMVLRWKNKDTKDEGR